MDPSFSYSGETQSIRKATVLQYLVPWEVPDPLEGPWSLSFSFSQRPLLTIKASWNCCGLERGWAGATYRRCSLDPLVPL